MLFPPPFFSPYATHTTVTAYSLKGCDCIAAFGLVCMWSIQYLRAKLVNFILVSSINDQLHVLVQKTTARLSRWMVCFLWSTKYNPGRVDRCISVCPTQVTRVKRATTKIGYQTALIGLHLAGHNTQTGTISLFCLFLNQQIQVVIFCPYQKNNNNEKKMNWTNFPRHWISGLNPVFPCKNIEIYTFCVSPLLSTSSQWAKQATACVFWPKLTHYCP